MAEVARLLLPGDSNKILPADATQFLRAALDAIAPPNTRETMAIINEENGFSWVLPPPREATAAGHPPARPPEAPSLLHPSNSPSSRLTRTRRPRSNGFAGTWHAVPGEDTQRDAANPPHARHACAFSHQHRTKKREDALLLYFGDLLLEAWRSFRPPTSQVPLCAPRASARSPRR